MLMKRRHKAKLDERDALAHNLQAGLAVALGNIGEHYIRKGKIKNERQLARAIEELKEAKERMPSAVRKAMKTLAGMLPRRGGPGRQPKLNPKEAGKACDQIALFIRQRHTLKEALSMLAELSPSLLGTKVGARTLQKAWNARGQSDT